MNLSEQHQALYFTTPNCSVCHALKPKLKAWMEENYPLLPFVEIDASVQKELAEHYKIYTAPVLVIKLEDKEFFRFSRAFSIGEVEQKLDRVYQLLFD
jgi:thioredoxin 1